MPYLLSHYYIARVFLCTRILIDCDGLDGHCPFPSPMHTRLKLR